MPYTRRLLTNGLLILFFVVGSTTNTASATTPFFWDEFDREDLFDTTVGWYDDPTPEEKLEIVDGSLQLTPLPFSNVEFPSAAVEIGRLLENFRIETAVALVDPEGPFVFTAIWNSEVNGRNDWSGLLADGRFTVGVTSNDRFDWENQPPFADEQDISSNDVYMTADVADGEQTLTIWLDGNERDAQSYTDRRVTAEVDWVNVGMNPNEVFSHKILVRHYALLPRIDGDYNASGGLDVGDIDLMSDQLRTPDPERVRVFDVNGDGETNAQDHSELVTELFGTVLGDANLNGEVAFDDFLALSTGFGNDGNWAQGDFDANGKVEFADFLLLSANFGSSVAATPVPEPSGLTLVLLAAFAPLMRRCRTARATLN